ncbi:hypothetical protein Tco_1577758 [Tanacetum coccineum]
MCTYLKNMEGYKLNDLKLKDFDSIQEMFDRAFKRVNTFEDFRTELVEGKEKRAGAELLIEIILDEEEVTIDAIPLAVKSPSIIGLEDFIDEDKLLSKIMRADGKVSNVHLSLVYCFKVIEGRFSEVLYKLISVWRNQQDYKVLDWKLYDSCRVHSLRMQHVHIYMLVEKKYPLIPSTLSMMLEKKLQINYESEMLTASYKFHRATT